jgi:L-alanine-DL-glutamate epimerase-like enolase superfamily enzyme
MKITKALFAECRIPLPYTLRLGPTQIATRDFVVLRIETDTGSFGEAIGYTRGTPLFDSMEMVARRIMGFDPLMRSALAGHLANANVPGRAAFPRAYSLVDIACWDILAKKAGMPLFVLLGGLRDRAAVTAVAGYYMDLRKIDDIKDEVSRLFDAGYRRVKFMLKGDDPDFDRRYLDSITSAAQGPVAADAHWSWATLTDAQRFCADLDEYKLDFLEDPFPASDIHLTHELQKSLTTRLAAGEDVIATRALLELVRGIGILRVDATTCGGITGAVEAIHHAWGAGRTVFPHVWAPLHIHLACAFQNVEGAEFIPAEIGADPIEKLLKNVPKVENGHMRPSEDPGVGINLDWAAIEKLCCRNKVVDASS